MAVMVVNMSWPGGTQTMQCTNVDVNDLRQWRSGVVRGAQEIDAEGKLAKAMREVGMIPKPSPAPRATRGLTQPYLAPPPLKPQDNALVHGATAALALA